MSPGNHIEHIVDDVLGGRSREMLWAAMRHAYFKHGSWDDAELAMTAWFRERGVVATLEDGGDSRGNPAIVVRFRPA